MRTRTKDGKFSREDDDLQPTLVLPSFCTLWKWIILITILLPWCFIIHSTIGKSFYAHFSEGMIELAKKLKEETVGCMINGNTPRTNADQALNLGVNNVKTDWTGR